MDDSIQPPMLMSSALMVMHAIDLRIVSRSTNSCKVETDIGTFAGVTYRY